jgi:hypothetical protein
MLDTKEKLVERSRFKHLDRGVPGDRCFLIGVHELGGRGDDFIEYLVIDEPSMRFKHFDAHSRKDAEKLLKRTRNRMFGWFWRFFLREQ